MSLPSLDADETAREVRGRVCPKCRVRWDDAALVQCPNDGAFLPRQVAPAAGVPAGPPSESSDPMLGRTLEGRYTILSRLGAGSMGTVYRARQHAMGREVAIKILRSDKAIDGASKARFLREARANSALASPHTVTVFDFGEAQTGELYLAMELLDGESVGQRLHREKRLSLSRAVDTARQALRSLAEAHAKGIIHRDLKPDNLFYARVQAGARQEEEIVKVVDFGIAKMLRDEDAPLNAVETQAGTVFGTPRYMSPEQAQGKPLDERSDLYSLGVILYQMVTGRPPFTDEDAIVVMARHIKTVPKRPSEVCPEAGCPPELERIIMGALAKEPKDRPLNADAFLQELHRVVDSVSAITSGVRNSVGAQRTSWAGVTPVPGLPARPRSAATIVALLAGLAVAVGAIVFLAVHVGLSSAPLGDLPGARPPPPRPAAVVTAAPRVLEPARAETSDVPTIAAENLPKASGSSSASSPSGPRATRATPPAAAGASATGKTARPAPSASGGYGIFD